MPGYAFLALLLGAFFTKKIEVGFSRWDIISVVLLTLLGLALPISAYIGMQQEATLVSLSYLAFGLVPTAIGTLLGFVFYFRKKITAFLLKTAFSWGILLFILHGYLYPNLTPVLPTTAVAEMLPKDANIVVYKRMDAAFPFNYQQTFEVIDNINDATSLHGFYLLTNHPEGQDLEKLPNIELVIRRKALFENHTTVLYRIE